MKKNYESDFVAKLTMPEGLEDADIKLEFMSTGGIAKYHASRQNGVLTNCVDNGDGTLMVVFRSHGLQPGLLKMKVITMVDSVFSEVQLKEVYPTIEDIELWDGPSDNASIDIDVIAGYAVIDAWLMAVKNGYTGTREEYVNALVKMPEEVDRGEEINNHPPRVVNGYWEIWNLDTHGYEQCGKAQGDALRYEDLTAAQKEELQRPAKESIAECERVTSRCDQLSTYVESEESVRDRSEQSRILAEQMRVDAEGDRSKKETLRIASEQERQAAETNRQNGYTNATKACEEATQAAQDIVENNLSSIIIKPYTDMDIYNIVSIDFANAIVEFERDIPYNAGAQMGLYVRCGNLLTSTSFPSGFDCVAFRLYERLSARKWKVTSGLHSAEFTPPIQNPENADVTKLCCIAFVNEKSVVLPDYFRNCPLRIDIITQGTRYTTWAIGGGSGDTVSPAVYDGAIRFTTIYKPNDICVAHFITRSSANMRPGQFAADFSGFKPYLAIGELTNISVNWMSPDTTVIINKL